MYAENPIQQVVSEAARRLYDAEVALHIAHGTGVDEWINAAADRLHEAVENHHAALAVARHPSSLRAAS